MHFRAKRRILLSPVTIYDRTYTIRVRYTRLQRGIDIMHCYWIDHWYWTGDSVAKRWNCPLASGRQENYGKRNILSALGWTLSWSSETGSLCERTACRLSNREGRYSCRKIVTWPLTVVSFLWPWFSAVVSWAGSTDEFGRFCRWLLLGIFSVPCYKLCYITCTTK